VIADKVTQIASALPPTAQGPYDTDSTFTFNAMNVYFNAPVDMDIISAPPVGSANTIRLFTDFQRDQQRGSFEFLDWPILLKEVPVNPNGSVSTSSPANIPLFEQLRTSKPGYTIPLTGRGISPDEMGGAAHVAGMNFGRTGEVQNCVGCHAGHTMIPLPATPQDAQWTNLAPGAAVTYSSLHSSLPNGNGAVDRKVKLRIAYNNHYRFWLSREGQSPNTQWLTLTFPVPITVRTIRLYDMPASESNVNVNNSTVRLYSDAAGTIQVASNTSGALSENGTNIAFNDITARVVTIQFTSVTGSTAGLGEVEVIARGEGISNDPGAGGGGSQVFADVSPTHPYFKEIEALYTAGYTSGCSANPLKYCPSTIMNRAQVAKFFMTVQFGSSYLPQANIPLLFKDNWSANSWAQSWANDMYARGLTSGCNPSPLLYCPDNQVTREQVAKFGLAIKYGNAYAPPPATGTLFADLTDVNYWVTPWAEQAYLDGLVPSCGTDIATGKPKFCKDGLVDRGFAAFVIVTAKGLLNP
jgi:hypothetical protein